MTAVDDLDTGAVVDGFRMGAALHVGAMGRIFEVLDDTHGFPLLMKLPRFGAVDSNELLLAFETEALVLERLSDPHVPRFVAAGDVATVPYIVMERVPGHSLDSRESPVKDVEGIVIVGAALADALHAIHLQGVVHLDVKPDNVMLHPEGYLVLVDFALSQHRDLPDLLAEEQRFAAGSAPYISPEQVRGVRGDPRSDLFSLGAVLYELVTGKLPFGAPRTSAGLRDRLWRDPVPPIAWNPAVPPWMQEVILRCLEPEADRRYQSAAHVAFDLRNPDQVPLTARSEKLTRERVMRQAARWWRARDLGALSAQSRSAAAPTVVMVAVDTMHPDDPRQPELQRATRRLLALGGEYRLICVSVIPGGPEYDMHGTDARDAPTEHRVRLRHWVDPLGLAAHRISLHVLQAADPAAALVSFGHRNHVDLIVLGAPAPDDKAFAWWRSVASGVTAQARCSVHVVRRPD